MIHICLCCDIVLSIYSCVESPCTLCVCVCPGRWLPEVQNIFFQGNRRKQIPLEHLDSFFDGVAVMMTNQLREMALDSIADYLHIVCPPKVHIVL